MAGADRLRLLSPTGLLGSGFTEVALDRGLEMGLDVIAVDGGSMDPGPYSLGSGKPFQSPSAIERDLRLILKGARAKGIPVLIGSAGGGGGIPHVAFTREVIERIAKEERLSFKMAVIEAEPSRDLIAERLRAGRVRPLWPVPEIDEATVRRSSRIVAMMGPEPLQEALRQGADVVLAGRCSDSALFAAIPLMRGFDPGLAWHLGKTLECAGAIVRPKVGQDCVIGTIARDHFVVEPGHPEKRVTPATVSAHTMYENPSPFEFVEPPGSANTYNCRYEALDDRTVRVTGSSFKPAPKYTVKLEGVEMSGYRAIFMAGVRDPILISQMDSFIAKMHERVRGQAISLGIDPESYTLTVRRYGNGAPSGGERPKNLSAEVGLFLDVVANTQAHAMAILAKARYVGMHTEFEGRLCTAGNLAIPLAPSEVPVGEAYRFSVWHVMELDDPLEVFPIEMLDVGRH